MKYALIFTALIVLFGCGTGENSEAKTEKSKKEVAPSIDLEGKIKRHVQSQLNLTAADKFELSSYKRDLNGDDSLDYIVTVNLLDQAIKKAIADGKEDKMKEMGYMGYYNYIFFVDGATKEISGGTVIPSSPMYPLKVTFEKVLGSPNMDFTIDYRVRNMQRRKFFTIVQNQPREVCQAVIFDGLGTSKTVAYSIRYEEGTFNDFNDIVEYEAQLEDIIIPNLDSTYTYEPTITPKSNIIRRWHFSPAQGKYFLVQK